MATEELANDLNDLLKGEISACETYSQAIEKVELTDVRKLLETNQQCHISRVQTLKDEVAKAGGKPVEGAGVWGAFAKFMEGGATVFGDKASVSTLEEGEDRGLADYKKFFEKHSVESAPVIAELQKKQDASHARCRDLKHSMP